MKPHLRLVAFVFSLLVAPLSAGDAATLAGGFAAPPASARPWVFWFWINGNITKAGITADLEAMQRVGIGGVLWMEVSGPWWAPEGPMVALSPQWHDAMQWAIRECDRLGLEFDLSVDFGYGSGGPHITPELSMQKLYWSETEVDGGRPVSLVVPRPVVPKNLSAWLRPGAALPERVRQQVETIDSYRDVAVLAIPAPAAAAARAYRLPELNLKDGADWRLPRGVKTLPPAGAVVPLEQVIDLTGRLDADGRLAWDAPPGRWLILRCGHASNYKMTRPSPGAAVGLECDRLATAGIDAHFDAFLKPIFTAAGAAAGRTLKYVHVDSWEAGGQNWTATFPAEFRARRGYDLRRWLPVLAGRVVGNPELSERFLWDVRATVSELHLAHYAGRLRDRARPFGIKFSTEAYGHLCIDNLAYAGVGDFPISEFWATGDERFPRLKPGYERSTKVMASAAHTYGRSIIGAEAFTSDRGWRDHPFLLKAMGDQKFCEGLNRVIFHLSAHQAYDAMVPGLTHRKWGEHLQRHNTWWSYSGPWMDYLARCQHLLQQGEPVADVCVWFGEGAPLNVNDMTFALPSGYDFDLCAAELVAKMTVKDGRVVLPSGMSYRYLRLPDAERMTLPLARRIRDLVAAGARVVGGPRPRGTPGLTDHPRADAELEKIAAELWDGGRVISGRTMAEVFTQDGLAPDFEGEGLSYVHRRVGGTEVYFVSHPENRGRDVVCTFRVSGKRPELWDPETGARRELPAFEVRAGRTAVPLRFAPMQSWFVVFRAGDVGPAAVAAGRNWPEYRALQALEGPWAVRFDPRWGGPKETVSFARLADWSQHAEPGIRFFSGTATYSREFELADLSPGTFLDLGTVEVMARVRVNGRDCGVAWKPPYRVDITAAARRGRNQLEIDVVNLWVNRLIGDEHLPLDGKWKDFETLLEWPEWFRQGGPRPSGRYTFTTARHYQKDSPLASSGLLGPVTIQLAAP
ncbi:MAG: hypothetical protein HZC55_28205 [Verrucomicrobia bacterium]|nr:hypothetical protein [Verrucomicrobiota bacterium]